MGMLYMFAYLCGVFAGAVSNSDTVVSSVWNMVGNEL